MSIYKLYPSLVRPIIFSMDPENAHNLTIKTGQFLSKPLLLGLMGQKVAQKKVEVMGLSFKNPVGLAAGMDKNGDAIDYFGALGFGFLELGTVTPKPQDGNPRPRMFRIKSAKGLINRMGFNNKGVDYLVTKLQERHYDGIIGVSIGKNETTAIENAADDYIYCMNKVYPFCDYIAVNISCPNTQGLTALQESEPLVNLLTALKNNQAQLHETHSKYVPLVVKIAPDLSDEQLKVICESCIELKIDGITCTNTTTSRVEVDGLEHASEWGGLSGQPLRNRANQVLNKVHEIVGDKIPLIGVGGVDSVLAAREKFNSGAQLVQLYSALIYEGPAIVEDIVNNL